MLRNTALEHDIGEGLDHAEAIDPPCHPDGQTFTGVLVDQGHQSQCSTVMSLGSDEVVAPNVIAPFRSEPDARAVVEPQPAPRALLLGNLQALPSPDAPDTVYADGPAIVMKQGRDPAITIPAIFRSQRDDSPCQRIFIGANRGDVSLRPPRLADDAAGPAFGESISLARRLNSLPPPVRR